MMFEHPDGGPVLVLDKSQSWRLLRHTSHGRLGLSVADQMNLVPVNFRIDQDRIVFRTAPGKKLTQLKTQPRVIFQADGILSDQAWSVLARGTARVLESPEDVERAEGLGITTWIPTVKEHFVEIAVEEIHGRHFVFGTEPEA